MRTVTLTRTFETPPSEIRAAMDDLGSFMEAAGFDEVVVDDDTLEVANSVGVATIELTLDVVEDADTDAALVYRQREGIFETMETRYVVTESEAGSEVTATTEFALDIAVIGGLLDATVIERQRRAELSAQFEWLESTTGA